MQKTDVTQPSAFGHNLALKSSRSFPSSGGSPATPPPQQNGPSGGAGATGIRGTISSAIALVRSPASFIEANKDTTSTVSGIMLKYVAVLAAIPFIATLIGDLWYYALFVPFGFGLSGSIYTYAFVAAILTYVLDIVAVYVLAIVIKMLAPTFNSTVDQVKSLKLAAYIFTPAFLIAILDIIPLLGIVTILGVLYGLYILYIGLPIMLTTPKEKVVTYVVAVVVATLVIYLVIGAIIGVATSAILVRSLGYFY